MVIPYYYDIALWTSRIGIALSILVFIGFIVMWVIMELEESQEIRTYLNRSRDKGDEVCFGTFVGYGIVVGLVLLVLSLFVIGPLWIVTIPLMIIYGTVKTIVHQRTKGK